MFRNLYIKSILFACLLSSCAYLRETPSWRENIPVGPDETKTRPSTGTQAPAASLSPQITDIEDIEFINIYSAKLGYTLSGNENQRLIREIASWLGTAYRFGGQTRMGVDCSGFVRAVYQVVYGIDLARITTQMAINSKRIQICSLQEGDLVFFKIDKRRISHVGIYLGNGRFVHASTSSGVIISRLQETYYRQRFAFGGRPFL